MTEVTGQFTGFSHYKTIFANQAFLLAVKNTLRFTLTGIPLLLICGFLIALLFSGSGKAQILKPLYLLPYALPAERAERRPVENAICRLNPPV